MITLAAFIGRTRLRHQHAVTARRAARDLDQEYLDAAKAAAERELYVRFSPGTPLYVATMRATGTRPQGVAHDPRRGNARAARFEALAEPLRGAL